jgi:hypothetical protein
VAKVDKVSSAAIRVNANNVKEALAEPVDPNLTLTDVDAGTTLDGATVTITDWFILSEADSDKADNLKDGQAFWSDEEALFFET